MTSRERVWAALAGRAVDRPPVSFWGHFYDSECTAAELVEATLASWREFGWDWIKLNPRKQYHVEPWGVRYVYPGTPRTKPRLTEWPIHAGGDWARITPRRPDEPALAEQVEAVRLLRRALPAEVPLVETVFTPLAVLGEMTETPGELRAHMDSHPELVRGALEAVTATYEPFVSELLRAGADGIYFATVDWASTALMSAADYRAWARPTDLRLMAAAAGAPFNVLHVCRGRNLLFECADYPVAAFSWAATDPTNPTLADGLARLPGAVMGGLSHEGPLLEPAPAASLAELERARTETGGRRWLAAPGCSIPPSTPADNLRAIRDALTSERGD
jgi:uroporphyrinogen decarboxylase